MRHLAIAVASLSLFSTVGSTPTVHAAGPSQSAVLYRWAFPAKGSTGPWSYRNHVLTYGGLASSTALARFKLKHVARFAVQATIRGLGLGPIHGTLAGYGLVVRQVPGDPHTSIEGGSFQSGYGSYQSEDTNPELYWNGDTIGGAAFAPGTAWHAYRLEVRDNEYTLLIDGKQMVTYRIDDYSFPTAVGVFSLYDRVQVKNFSVLSLGSAGTTSTPPLPLKRLNLGLADLPKDIYFQPQLSHYYTNDETARERGVSLQTIAATGRIAGYAVEYFPWDAALTDLYSSVAAFRTPAEAQADTLSRLKQLEQTYASSDNYQTLPAPAGDVGGGFRVSLSSGGFTVDVVALLFSRGSYFVLIRTAFNADPHLSGAAEIAQANALAKVVDAHITGS